MHNKSEQRLLAYLLGSIDQIAARYGNRGLVKLTNEEIHEVYESWRATEEDSHTKSLYEECIVMLKMMFQSGRDVRTLSRIMEDYILLHRA